MKNAQVKLTVDTQSAVKSVGDLNNEINETAEVTKTLKQQLREMTIELQGLEPGTAEFNKMTAAAGQLRDQIADTNAAINATAGSSVENLAGAVTNMAGVGISAFQGIAGAQAMFGSDSEELMKLMAKLQGAMALGQALKDFGGLGDTLTNIKAQLAAATAGSQLFNKATVAQAVATGTATSAQKVMNAVMNANPVFLIIGGITALIGAFALFGGASQNAAEDTENLNSALDKQSESLEKNYNLFSKYYGSLVKGKQIELEAGRKVIEQQIALLEMIPEKTAAQNNKLKALRNELFEYNKDAMNKEATEANNAAAREIELNKDLLKNKKEQLKNEEALSKQALADRDGDLYAATQERISILEDEISETETLITTSEINKVNTLAEYKNKAVDLLNERARELKAIQIKEHQESLKRIEEYNNKLLAYYDAVEADRQANITDARDKELQEAANHYDDLTKLADAANQSTVEITKNYQNKVKEINSRFDLEEANNKKKLLAEIAVLQEEALLQEELNLADSEEQKELIRASHYTKLIQLKTKQIEAERDILLTNTKLTEEERQKIIAESNLKIAELNEKAVTDTVEVTQTQLQKAAEAALEFYSKISATVQMGLDTMQMAFDLYNENQAAKREEQYAAEEEAIKDSLANRLISQEEYDNQVAALEDQKKQKERAAKKKQFDQDKANNIINAVMSGAQAVLAALTLPPPLSYVLAAVNAALAGAQIGIIASQKFHAARGGVVPGMESKVDSVDAKLAPGEMVINSSSASMFPTLLSEINKAGGGIPLAPEPVSNLTSGGRNIYAPNTQRIEAYVVESQLSSTSRRVKRMEESASF